jgi:hypothetical protein
VRETVRHWIALGLLAALFAGPFDVAGVLHPIEDPDCGAAVPDDGHQRQPSWRSASAPDPHCPICHVLRSVRYGTAVVPTQDLVPAAPCGSPVPDREPPSADAALTFPGRSPPAR